MSNNDDDSKQTISPTLVIGIIVTIVFIVLFIWWYAARWYRYCTEALQKLEREIQHLTIINDNLRGQTQAMRKNIKHGDNTIEILRKRITRMGEK